MVSRKFIAPENASMSWKISWEENLICVGMAMAIFCFVGVIFDITYKGNFKLADLAISPTSVKESLLWHYS